jgi:hypothetical protein
MGQRRAVTVIKFVMKGSVESRLYDLATVGFEATKKKLAAETDAAAGATATTAAITTSTASAAVAAAGAPAPAPAAAIANEPPQGGAPTVTTLATSKTIVGHLRSDSIKLNAASFDLLFGITDENT